MKNSADAKQIQAAWSAVKEVEQLAERITKRTEAPKLLWQQRQRELAALERELEGEAFDPLNPMEPTALARHTDLTVKVAALRKLCSQQPKSFPIAYGADGTVLFGAILKLQQIIWALAEPFELTFETLRRHGVFALSPVNYNPAAGAARLICFSQNFCLEGGQTIVSLAREILSRRVPSLPSDFGTISRPLTYQEQQLIASRSTPVTAAA